ncbi:MAG: glycoside hydrolase family 130 protein [Deltaproteobacteria bacterium]|nr:glycoside hydrolase family 130 protein [Deltaproteobacteria bacterium]MBW2553232.1 glycoside hydrolase family 130 protein [Deltaproteobacteria bacterium]
MTHNRRSYARDTVHRWEGNPLITISDLDFKCSDIRNASVVQVNDELMLFVDIEHLAGSHCIHLARQQENRRFLVDKDPFMCSSTDPRYAQHESQGVMDPRITFLDDVYYIMYVANGDHGFRIGLAKTRDFKSVERIGLISEPDTKGGALFPSKINGKYARLERPTEGNSIWISYSDDLIYWGESKSVLSPRDGFWDLNRVGTGPPPVEIEKGWLIIYYGVKETSAGPLYRLGAVVLDKEDPTKVLGRSNIPILSPREDYERIGDTPNIVFATGALIEKNGSLEIYYGAADSCICMGTANIEEIQNICLNRRKGC